MNRFFRFLSLFATLPALCFVVDAMAPSSTNAQIAQTAPQTAPRTSFPDVPSNYWARPFIERLAQRNILAGYPDGTFRPEQTMQRDELAAVIRRAFNQPPVKQIESGSVFNDVNQGYWAERPIESASEQGFMSGDGQGNFRPNQPVTRVQAITALNRGLNLASGTPTATASTQRVARRRPVFVPIAITSLMQSVILPRAEAAPVQTPTNQATQPSSASEIVNKYYTDANKIPQNAVSDVAVATQQNIVVNHPNPKVLNPNQAATRAEIAALVHQTLVNQGQLEPMASQYIVK